MGKAINLMIINTHDTGVYNSVYGNTDKTPNLLDFSKDAVSFSEMFSVSPTCSPSRGAMLTGMYPHQNGLMGLAHRGFEIADTSKHLASFLADNGYETVLSGVQHECGYWLTEDSGFKLGYEKVITDFENKINTDDDYIKFDNDNADRVCSYLESRNDKRPFYVSYGMFSTHRKYPTNRSHVDMNHVKLPDGLQDTAENRDDTAGLLTSLECFDNNFGKVIAALKKCGEYDNTVIIYTTDHGLANPFAKCNLERSGSNVSFVLRNPKNNKRAGESCNSLLSQIDVYPTICQALNIKAPQHLQGKSFIECLEKDTQINEEIFQEINFHTSYEPCCAVRNREYLYIEYGDTYDGYNLSNIDVSPAKQSLLDMGIESRKKDMLRLYNLCFDSAERNNVAQKAEYSNVILERKAQLESWKKKVGYKILQKSQYPPHSRVNKKTAIFPSIRSSEDME